MGGHTEKEGQEMIVQGLPIALLGDDRLSTFADRSELDLWTLEDIARWLTGVNRYGYRHLWLENWEASDDTWLALSLDRRVRLESSGEWTKISWNSG